MSNSALLTSILMKRRHWGCTGLSQVSDFQFRKASMIAEGPDSFIAIICLSFSFISRHLSSLTIINITALDAMEKSPSPVRRSLFISGPIPRALTSTLARRPFTPRRASGPLPELTIVEALPKTLVGSISFAIRRTVGATRCRGTRDLGGARTRISLPHSFWHMSLPASPSFDQPIQMEGRSQRKYQITLEHSVGRPTPLVF
ncbi:hypothetical protein BDK51DRAFT_38101 [Blyttiomyces helicus]|uniref:Uncharacterized protein n=1 Tax=Blyttiomyces helicus TaxID=388810 RepID=A0A4P9W6S6_9FUNG|nr:hypothetical protein BDK51DRAFT_38101 [Blyttiomyces helicus]|eukprot:RKO86658.1 hypothetical protein BDK51DRAFT_38101 [Blyttiomyces helicus]